MNTEKNTYNTIKGTHYSINPNTSCFSEAKSYMDYRSKQLLKFGYRVTRKKKIDDLGWLYIYDRRAGFSTHPWISFYLLKGKRGRGFYKKIVKKYSPLEKAVPIVSLEKCALEDYLNNNPDLSGHVLKHSQAYKLIQSFYADKRTKRSKVPLIYHIDEGMGILTLLNAPEYVKDAYALHPLAQGSETMKEFSGKVPDMGIPWEALALAWEYRGVANSYLRTKDIKDFTGFTSNEVKQMLIADKVQNFKDFMKFHYGFHSDSSELFNYFMDWETLLEIEYHKLLPIINHD